MKIHSVFYKRVKCSKNKVEIKSFPNRNKITHQCTFDLKSMSYYFPINFNGSMKDHLSSGAKYIGSGKTNFSFYAPKCNAMFVVLSSANSEFPNYQMIPLEKKDDTFIKNGVVAYPSDRYCLFVQNKDGDAFFTYDPYAAYLPNDIKNSKIKLCDFVMDASCGQNWAEIVSHDDYVWGDSEWMNKRKNNNSSKWELPRDMIAEEIHIGLIGGFKKGLKVIDTIARNGVANTIKLMPIGEFYGKYNWGYDESCKYAVENNYGTPNDLKNFIDYAHSKNIRVILDVVPNHFGPYGTNIDFFLPAFLDKEGPWGKKLNYNDKNGMVKYMTNMLMNWAVNYHIDGFRFDSTQNMENDEALISIVKELRSHEETKDLILYPEDQRVSKVIANKNLPDKNIGLDNWGFNGQTTYDFLKSVMALATNREVYGIFPSTYSLEWLFKQGVWQFHEDIMKGNTSLNSDIRDKMDMISKYPTLAHNNLLVDISNHDEVGNAGGGRRAIANIMYFLIDIQRLFSSKTNDIKWKLANNYMKLMFAEYMKKGTILNPLLQVSLGCESPISHFEFENAFQKAKKIYKVMLATMFLHPSPKEFLMGEDMGEIAPFQYFADIPEENMENYNQLLYEKGYNPNYETFLDCRPSFYSENKTPKQKELSDNILNFSQDCVKLLKTKIPLCNASFNNILTYSYPKEFVLEIKYSSTNAKDIVAVLNFSPNNFPSFRLNQANNIRMKELINSDNFTYGGDLSEKMEPVSSNNIYIRPYSVVIYEKL